MSFAYVCDFCGREIDADDELLTMSLGSIVPLSRRTGWVGHYHRDDCWAAMHDRIKLVHETADALGAIDTISNQAVAARRRKHTKPGDES